MKKDTFLWYLVIVSYGTTVVLGQDPCLDANHQNISHIGKRYILSSSDGTCKYTDNRLQTGWYYAGTDSIVTYPPEYCSCGYNWPVWMKGSLPTADEGVVNRRACANFMSSCHESYDIQVKNCGHFYVYYLTKVMADAGYCFGTASPFTTEPPAVKLPNVTIDVPNTRITENSFHFVVMTSYDSSQTTIDIVISQANGAIVKTLRTNATIFQYNVTNLQPNTTYTIEVLTGMNGANHSLETMRVTTRMASSFTTESPTVILPNVTIEVPNASITENGFHYFININTHFDPNRTSINFALLGPHGTMMMLTGLQNSFDAMLGNATPNTNYTIEVWTDVNGVKYSLGMLRITTKKHQRDDSAKIVVDNKSLISNDLNFTVRYSAGSETSGADCLVTCPNLSESLRFNITEAVTDISVPTLTAGTNCTILAYADEDGNTLVLDSTWASTPPDITPYNGNGQTHFRCGFVASSDDTLYRVKWTIQRTRREPLVIITNGTPKQDTLTLSEEDLISDHVYVPFQISCSIGEGQSEEPSGQDYSLSSKELFAGLEVLTPTIVMYRDETAVVKVSPTIPSSCQTVAAEQNCNLTLAILVPSQNKCSGISTRQCQVVIPGETGAVGELEIQASEDGQYGVIEEETHSLVLRVSKPLNSIWEKYSVQITVKVLPENATYWRGKSCEALNDPHMYTFDGRSYEHHESSNDEFLLYEHSKYDVKIHHKLERCNTNAMCNCGVAVQAGRDVYVVSTCNNMLEIGFKQCDDGVILVKQESDTLYSIYLPYGTYVKARVDNTPYADSAGSMIVSISVFPSVHDLHGRSEGLCGTLDNHPENDMGDTDSDRLEFIHKWSVPASESIFRGHNTLRKPWKSPVCMCNIEHGHVKEAVECTHATDHTCTKGRRVGKQLCTLAEKRPIGSNMPVLQLGTTSNSPSYMTAKASKEPKSITTVSTAKVQTKTNTLPGQVTKQPQWTEAKAKDFCMRYMDSSRVYRLCSHVPYSDTDRAIKTCTLDVVITQSTHWQRISRSAMQEACMSEIHRNTTVREEKEPPVPSHLPSARSTLSTPTYTSSYSHNSVRPDNMTTTSSPIDADVLSSITNIVKELESSTCPNECNDQGVCKNGTCECYPGYGGDDCFIDITKPPSSSTIIHGNKCDESQVSCTHVYVYGGLFASKTVSCHVTSYQTYADVEGKQDMDAYVIHGQPQSLVQVLCPLIPTRKRRSVTSSGNHVKLMSCYRVSVSNDGIHHSEPLKMCVFNSVCQILRNDTNGLLTALIKPGYCYIDGQCISHGTRHVKEVCDPLWSLYQWSIQEHEQSPLTTEGPVKHPIPTENNINTWKTPAIIATVTVCVVISIVVAVFCIRKQRANKVKGNVDEYTDHNEDKLDISKEKDEEVYDHINPTDVQGELPRAQMQPYQYGDYEYIAYDYTKLQRLDSTRSDYNQLHQGDVIHLQDIPPLPSRTTDAYTKLTALRAENKDYAKLRVGGRPDEDYLTPVHQDNSEMNEGYERPAPQKIRKY